MIDLNNLRTPKADNPVQVKYTLSSTAREKLRRASAYTGQDMSTLLELLIRDHLPDPGAATPLHPIPQRQQDDTEHAQRNRFDLDI